MYLRFRYSGKMRYGLRFFGVFLCGFRFSDPPYAPLQVTSTNLLERGPQRSPALQMARFSVSSASTLLFLVLNMCVDGSRGNCGPKCPACTAIPFTLCDVPSTDDVSSRRSMLSYAKVLLTWGWMLSSNGISLVDAIFWKHSAVLISSSWE